MDRILIVEDADSLRDVLKTFLESKDYLVDAFASAEEALPTLSNKTYSCILADFKLPGKNGIELLQETRQIWADVPYIIMTAFGSVDIAVEAMKQGANDFITKPFDPEMLSAIITQVIRHKRILDRDLCLKTRRERRFLTNNAETKKLLEQARKVASVDSSILILGESGTGKELIARYIHEHSFRCSQPFAAVNCAALPADLLESEFFGHEAGSYTGATQKRIGVFEYASRGTIFLDEIGDMPAALQVKLLRALQEKEIKRIGSNIPISVNPRIITATNHEMEAALDNQSIREDFYYRVAVIDLHILPLRERPEDIELLADHFIEYFCNVSGREQIKLSDSARAVLSKYSWPGNTRELENVIERAVIMAEDIITPAHLGINLDLDYEALENARLTLQEISSKAARKAEIEVMTKVLQRTSGNKTKAAKILGISYKTLLNKVKEYELDAVR